MRGALLVTVGGGMNSTDVAGIIASPTEIVAGGGPLAIRGAKGGKAAAPLAKGVFSAVVVAAPKDGFFTNRDVHDSNLGSSGGAGGAGRGASVEIGSHDALLSLSTGGLGRVGVAIVRAIGFFMGTGVLRGLPALDRSTIGFIPSVCLEILAGVVR